MEQAKEDILAVSIQTFHSTFEQVKNNVEAGLHKFMTIFDRSNQRLYFFAELVANKIEKFHICGGKHGSKHLIKSFKCSKTLWSRFINFFNNIQQCVIREDNAGMYCPVGFNDRQKIGT